MYTDEILSCVECSADFVFSAGEQEFFATKGFQNKPNRCPACRAARKASRPASATGSAGGGARREMFATTCSQCGQSAEVPFQPRGDKPVFCNDCFKSRSSGYR